MSKGLIFQISMQLILLIIFMLVYKGIEHLFNYIWFIPSVILAQYVGYRIDKKDKK